MGGESGIRRVWKQFNIRPNVVYVPDNRDVPEWCDSAALPTIVVRCPPIDINRSLLHSLHNDGYAAEFPLQTPPSIESAIDPENRLLIITAEGLLTQYQITSRGDLKQLKTISIAN